MSAFLKPSGMLKNYVQGQAELPVEPGLSIKEALTQAGIPSELVALALVNERPEAKDYILQDGDILQVIAVIGGG